MQSLRDVIGGNLQAVAVQAADRVTMLVQGGTQCPAVGLCAITCALACSGGQLGLSSRSGRREALDRPPDLLWEQGGDHAASLLNGELSRFLLETKIRDGDKVIGLMILDRHGALVAASSEPDKYFFGNESWWTLLGTGGTSCISAGEFPRKRGHSEPPMKRSILRFPILDDRQQQMIGAVIASYRFDSLFAMIAQIQIGQTGHAMLFDAAGQPLVVRFSRAMPIVFPVS